MCWCKEGGKHQENRRPRSSSGIIVIQHGFDSYKTQKKILKIKFTNMKCQITIKMEDQCLFLFFMVIPIRIKWWMIIGILFLSMKQCIDWISVNMTYSVLSFLFVQVIKDKKKKRHINNSKEYANFARYQYRIMNNILKIIKYTFIYFLIWSKKNRERTKKGKEKQA
jgi:hypothetical protein